MEAAHQEPKRSRRVYRNCLGEDVRKERRPVNGVGVGVARPFAGKDVELPLERYEHLLVQFDSKDRNHRQIGLFQNRDRLFRWFFGGGLFLFDGCGLGAETTRTSDCKQQHQAQNADGTPDADLWFHTDCSETILKHVAVGIQDWDCKAKPLQLTKQPFLPVCFQYLLLTYIALYFCEK